MRAREETVRYQGGDWKENQGWILLPLYEQVEVRKVVVMCGGV